MKRFIICLMIVLSAAPINAAQYLKEDTATTVQIGPFLDATDGVTPETINVNTLEGQLEVSKNNAAFAARTSTTDPTDDGDGWYILPLDTTDTSTPGRLIVKAVHTATYQQVWVEFMVLPANIFDSIYGTDLQDVNAAQTGGTNNTGRDIGASVLLSNGTGTGQVALSGGTLSVNAAQLGGTTQTGRDIGASVLLSVGTGAGQVSITSGVLNVNVEQMMGGSLSENAAGNLASGISAFFDNGTGGANDVSAQMIEDAYNLITAVKTQTDKFGAMVTGSAPDYAFDAAALAGVWTATTRRLSDGTNIVLAKGTGITGFNDPSSADNATAVWGAGTRTLTAGTNIVLAKGTGITGFNDLSSQGVGDAVWDDDPGDHGNIDSYGIFFDEMYDEIFSGGGGGGDAPTAVENAAAVWAAATRTLSNGAITTNTFAAGAINQTVLATGAIGDDEWNVTEVVNSSMNSILGTALTDPTTGKLATGFRNFYLATSGTSPNIYKAGDIIASFNDMPEAVWGYSSRSITDKAGFGLAADAITSGTLAASAGTELGTAAGTAVWATSSRSLSSGGNSSVATAVSAIWNGAEVELSSAARAQMKQDVADAMLLVPAGAAAEGSILDIQNRVYKAVRTR